MGKGGVGKRRSNKGFQRTGGTALARSSVVQAEVRSGFAPAAEPWALGGRMSSRAVYLGSITIKANEVSDGEPTQEATEHVDLLAS